MADITITPAAPRGIAAIGALRDRAPLLAALQAEFGAAMPTTPGFLLAGPVTISCLTPSRYLASGPPDADVPARLAELLAGLAAVTDQSDQWACFVLTGADIRETLARLVPIDLEPRLFRVGDLALTRAAHVNVRLWRTAAQTYELAVTRSYAADLRHFLALAFDP
jgi:sarcosine oxidase subunit gamma